MNNKFVSNHKIKAIDVIMQNLNVSKLFKGINIACEKWHHDHVHSIIDVKNFREYEENFELTHNKNIFGFHHIFNDFLDFQIIL